MAKKQHAKGRLDKYYYMAKEQGYRARSAFKLIQLNKKFQFLEQSKVVVDLCAAPGGWLQVCAKYMPQQSLIVGVDLVPIKPVAGVTTFVDDITTGSCRSTLKSELKGWKADVFLHDGAPNVGTSWLQDAFTQAELTLSALKLSTEFLVAGGTFVTKVFRSKDYNKLLWLFQQLFDRVEATKPASSRNVSAEIFVVCRGFKAPKRIDPKLLDPRWALKEVDAMDSEHMDAKQLQERQGAMLNDLFHPEKRRRQREGYADGQYTLHTVQPVDAFIQSSDYLGILARSNQLSLLSSECQDETLLSRIITSALTTEEIREYLSDLKVLGKKEFKQLIRWRESMRFMLGLQSAKQTAAVTEEQQDKPVDEDDIEAVLLREEESLVAKQRRAKKKQRERKAKLLLRLRLGMETPDEIGLDAGYQGLEAFPEFDDQDEHYSSNSSSSSDDDGSDSDNEVKKVDRLEADLDLLYEAYQQRKIERNPTLKVKKAKEEKNKLKQEFDEWYGVAYDKQNGLDETAQDTNGDSSCTSDDENEGNSPDMSRKAKIFFDNPIFNVVNNSLFDKEMVDANPSDSEEDNQEEKRTKNKRQKMMKAFDDDDEEVLVKQHIPTRNTETNDSDIDDFVLDTAEKYSLAQRMLTASGKRDLIDDAFNRYAFNEAADELPHWFVQDEDRHNKPSMPVTKEAVEIIKQKQRALDARPIKKVAEAKFRKQMRLQRRMAKSAKKAEGVLENDNDEQTDKSKLEAIAKLMQKAKAKPRQSEKPKLVVAKGMNRGQKGRPKGVKGRYKMVDSRMKKELRADKRTAAASKKRRR